MSLMDRYKLVVYLNSCTSNCQMGFTLSSYNGEREMCTADLLPSRSTKGRNEPERYKVQ